MPKYVLTLRIGLNDSETTFEQVSHLKDLLTEIAMGMAPGSDGSVGSSIEDQYQLQVKHTAAERRLRSGLLKIFKQLNVQQPNDLDTDLIINLLKRVGYVPQA